MAYRSNEIAEKPYNTSVPQLGDETLGTAADQGVAAPDAFAVPRWWHRLLCWTALCSLLSTAAVFLALHLVHLRADFPNGSPWSDWAKYTDEGWYGDAAIRHYLRGTWHLPGDFNPAAALPVWPLLEALIFRFTGVGIVAARALTVVVFMGIVASGALLLRKRLPVREPLSRWTLLLSAAAAALLMAVSPYFFVFSRMAVLEPLLVLLTLLALLTAAHIRPSVPPLRNTARQVALGVLLALMIGTKTTAVALVPAIAWMLADACRWRIRPMVRAAAVAGGTTLVLWATYYLAFIRPRYLQDFQYLFSANSYTGINAGNAGDVLLGAFRDGFWIGHVIYPLLFTALALSLVRPRVWRDSVFVSLVLWMAGYFAFLIYHANLQPRYYLVIAVPMTLLVVRGAQHALAWNRRAAWLLAPAMLLLAAHDARGTLHYLRHPDYTFQDAAIEVGKIVESEPNHSHTVLSISGSDLSLMTGLPSICDDFGTMQLEDRIAAYKPGWFVAWNYVEDDKMDALGKFYQLTRVAEFPAMDDPERNLMIVYRLDPKRGVEPRRRRTRKLSPLAAPRSPSASLARTL